MFLPLDNASKLILLAGFPGLKPTFDNEAATTCPLGHIAITGAGMLPITVVDDVTVG